MNSRLKGNQNIILMSLRRGAPYADRIEEAERVIVYEGRDIWRTSGGPEPKDAAGGKKVARVQSHSRCMGATQELEPVTRLCRFISSGVPGARWHALNLKGFKRIHLEAGQKQTVQFTPEDRDPSIEDESGQRLIVAGDVQVWIGGGQTKRSPEGRRGFDSIHARSCGCTAGLS